MFNHLAMNLVLHSERLALAPYSAADLDLSLAMFTDPVVVKFAGAVMSELAVTNKMSDWMKRGGNGCIGVWTVADRNSRAKLGSVALLPMPVDQDDTNYSRVVPGKMPAGDVEIGYYLKRTAWGHGYATEACRRLLQFAFEETPLTEVVATFHQDNLASRNVLGKVGFRDHGTMRCYGKRGLNFRIARHEWLNAQ